MRSIAVAVAASVVAGVSGYSSGSGTCSHLLSSITGGMTNRDRDPVDDGGYVFTFTNGGIDAAGTGYVAGNDYDVTLKHNAAQTINGFLAYAVSSGIASPELATRQGTVSAQINRCNDNGPTASHTEGSAKTEVTFTWTAPPAGTGSVDFFGIAYNTAGLAFFNPPVLTIPEAPTDSPTTSPTASPTAVPTDSPTTSPTASTDSPTASPTSVPTATPSASPTASPTATPSASPTASPTASPSGSSTASPTASPSASPTTSPTASPSASPTTSPSVTPSAAPIDSPSRNPTTINPTSANPTLDTPTANPTTVPSLSPTASTTTPSTTPTDTPTTSPTDSPTVAPTTTPSNSPSSSPTDISTLAPSTSPSAPTVVPSEAPTPPPSSPPSAVSSSPTSSPSAGPTSSTPTKFPTVDDAAVLAARKEEEEGGRSSLAWFAVGMFFCFICIVTGFIYKEKSKQRQQKMTELRITSGGGADSTAGAVEMDEIVTSKPPLDVVAEAKRGIETSARLDEDVEEGEEEDKFQQKATAVDPTEGGEPEDSRLAGSSDEDIEEF